MKHNKLRSLPDTCPWWHAYTFDNVLRRLFYNTDRLFGPYVQPGMTVLDVGCGMGFNAIGLARLVGESGCVIAVDVRPQVLRVLERRARKAGVAGCIRTQLCERDSIGFDQVVGFINAFWMVHEVPDTRSFFEQTRACLAPGGNMFVAEPWMHVPRKAFESMLETARQVGLEPMAHPRVCISRAVVLSRS